MKIYIIWSIGFAAALIASILISVSLILPWNDEVYVDSLNLSPEADSLGISIFGSLIFILFLFGCVLSFYIGIVAGIRKGTEISYRDALLHRGQTSLNATKTGLVLFTLIWIFLFYSPYTYEYINGFYFVIDMLTIAFAIFSLFITCMIIGTFNKKQKTLPLDK